MKPPRFFRAARACAAAATLAFLPILLGGCAGYHIGAQRPGFMKGIQTLAVPTFKNDTLIPRIEVLVADTVIKQFQQDGTYQIASTEKADAVMEGAISEVRRRPARSVRSNVLATREFTMVLVLHYTIKKRGSDTIIREGTVDGTTSFFVSGGLERGRAPGHPDRHRGRRRAPREPDQRGLVRKACSPSSPRPSGTSATSRCARWKR